MKQGLFEVTAKVDGVPVFHGRYTSWREAKAEFDLLELKVR